MSEIKLPSGRIVQGTPDRLTVKGPGLVRNHDMVHRRWCYRVAGREVTAWDWPVGKSADEIATARENGLEFCRSCKPLDHVPHPTDPCPVCSGVLVHMLDCPNRLAGHESTDSRETCPEWNCPDLSTEDLREGKTCPDHPCTCPTGLDHTDRSE